MNSNLVSKLRKSGLDICHEFIVQDYNAHIKTINSSLVELETFGRQKTKGYLIGHSKRFWKPFLSWLHNNPEKVDLEHPVDEYGKFVVTSTFHEGVEADKSYYWAHETSSDKLVAIQRLADICGCAKLYEDVHLCIHEEFGPWIAFRAVVVMDEEAEEIIYNESKNVLSKEELLIASNAYDKAIANMSDKKAWIDLRDSISRFHEHRYEDDQLWYHYTKNQTRLHSALEKYSIDRN